MKKTILLLLEIAISIGLLAVVTFAYLGIFGQNEWTVIVYPAIIFLIISIWTEIFYSQYFFRLIFLIPAIILLSSFLISSSDLNSNIGPLLKIIFLIGICLFEMIILFIAKKIIKAIF